MKWYLQLLSVYTLVCSIRMQVCTSPPMLTCTSTINGVECNFKDIGLSPDRVSIDGDLMLVGSTDHLFAFDISESLLLNYITDHCPKAETLDTCLSENDHTQCKNFVRFLQPIPDNASNDTKYKDKVLVCGTNAFSPKCTVHSRGNLSEWFYLTKQEDDGFSPYQSNRQMVGLLGTNGMFYAATLFSAYGSQRRIAIAPNPLKENSDFSAATLDGNQYWLNTPNVDFISMYEMGDHIYVFARETAQFPELEDGTSIVYSRVMRICKNDQFGLPSSGVNQFLTFQKARMRCSSERNTPDYPYDYNEIHSTFLLNTSSGESVLYATFSSSPNGPKGSAVCKFEFNPAIKTSLTGVFESVEYFAPVNGDPTSTNWNLLKGVPFVCPGQLDGDQRDQQEVTNYMILMDGEAVATGDHDIYTADGVVFTQIAVETLTYDGSEYEIMFTGTDNGEIWQVVTIDDINTFEFKRVALPSASDITYIQLSVPNRATEIRKLYFANADFLSEITLGDCGKYANCWECLESNDPYCAWQNDYTCVNVLLQPLTGQKTEAILGFSMVTEVCGSKPPTQAPTSSTDSPQSGTEVECNYSPTATDRTDIPTSHTESGTETPRLPVSTDPTVLGLDPGSQSVSIAEVVGALVGGFIIGIIIGVVIGCVSLATKRGMFGTKSSPAAIENGTAQYNHNQTSVTITSPEPTKTNGVSSPISSGSSGLDIAIEELDDNVISDLPPSTAPPVAIPRKKKRGIPKGRTPSTRWLRASESEGNPP